MMANSVPNVLLSEMEGDSMEWTKMLSSGTDKCFVLDQGANDFWIIVSGGICHGAVSREKTPEEINKIVKNVQPKLQRVTIVRVKPEMLGNYQFRDASYRFDGVRNSSDVKITPALRVLATSEVSVH